MVATAPVEDAPLAALQRRLDARANPTTRSWWEAYLKGAISFRGVKMQEVRESLITWYLEDQIGRRPVAEQTELALALLRQPLAEDKLAGILMMREVLFPAGALRWRHDLGRLAALFDEGAVADWNTCDWLCVKVLALLVGHEGVACARVVAGWKTAPGLWRRRASVVTFATLAPRGDDNFAGFTDLLLDSCAELVRDPARFAQTGVGWAQRELSRPEPDRVADFVARHSAELSAEARRSATAKLPAPRARRARARKKR